MRTRIVGRAGLATLALVGAISAHAARAADDAPVASATPEASGAPPAGAGPARSARVYELAGDGRLLLEVPADWEQQVVSSGGHPPLEIAYRSAAGAPFEIYLSVLWNPTGTDPFDVEWARRAALEGAADAGRTDVSLRELQGESVRGYYFAVGGPAGGPPGLAFVAQGTASVGGAGVLFTILAPGPRSPAVRGMISALERARRER